MFVGLVFGEVSSAVLARFGGERVLVVMSEVAAGASIMSFSPISFAFILWQARD